MFMLLQQLQKKYEINLTHFTSINLSETYGEKIYHMWSNNNKIAVRILCGVWLFNKDVTLNVHGF